jgi:hypothetical protein
MGRTLCIPNSDLARGHPWLLGVWDRPLHLTFVVSCFRLLSFCSVEMAGGSVVDDFFFCCDCMDQASSFKKSTNSRSPSQLTLNPPSAHINHNQPYIYFLIIKPQSFTMTSDFEIEPSPPSTPASVMTHISESTVSQGTQSQNELPEHDEFFIHDANKIYKRGMARPAKQRERPPTAWYWKHGEEISEGKERRWLCKACWEDKKFKHYGAYLNHSISKHLEQQHGITQNGGTSAIPSQNTETANNGISMILNIFSWKLFKVPFIEWIVSGRRNQGM